MQNYPIKAKGFTQFKCFQMISSAQDTFEVHSLDYYIPISIPNHLTGVTFGSETTLMESIQRILPKEKQLRYYALFVEGGDTQPPPKNEAEVLQKKIISLDSNTTPYLRQVISYILGVSSDRTYFTDEIANNPSLLSQLWQEKLFANINAIQWLAKLRLPFENQSKYIRLVTVKDTSLITTIHCLSSPSTTIDEVKIIPWKENAEKLLKD